MALKVWLPLTGHLRNIGTYPNITMTNSGATVDTSGKLGSCYNFNGSSYIYNTSVSIPTTAWTMAAWICPGAASSTGHQYVVGINSASAADFLCTLCVYTNKLCVRIADTTYQTSTTYTLNTWYHLAAVYDGTLKIYVNGVLASTVTSPKTPASSTKLYIGERAGGAGLYTGKVNDVRIYDEAISAAEIKEISLGLNRHYKMDSIYNFVSGIGGSITDDSGYQNHAAIAIANTNPFDTDTARYSKCLKFVMGTPGLIEGNPLPTSTQTISAWFNTTYVHFSSDYSIAIHDKQTGLAVGWSSSGLITYVGSSAGGSGSKIDLTTTSYTANQWNHIVVVKTGDTTRDVYVNGVKASPTSNSYWGGDLTKLNIGGRHVNGNYGSYFYGHMSDFRAYSTQLSADDILALYKIGAKVANNGKMLAYELSEDGSPSVCKTGVACDSEFIEDGDICKIGASSIKATEFIEI